MKEKKKPGLKKGQTNNRNGRPKGAKDKVTADARKAITLFVDNNADKLEGWLNQIAKRNPAKAFECFMSVVEYHIPKLNRTTVVGEEDQPVGVLIVNDIPRPQFNQGRPRKDPEDKS